MLESANTHGQPTAAPQRPGEGVLCPGLSSWLSVCQFPRNMAGPSHLRMPRAGAQKVGGQASLTGVFFHSRNLDGAPSVLGDTVMNKTQVPVRTGSESNR